MKFTKIICSIFLIIFSSSFSAYVPCKGFVKKVCLPRLSPFIPNGQTHTTTMHPGGSTKLAMTFYSGQNYRILICAEEILGQVQFKLRDAAGNILFNSKDRDDTDFWDFKVASTQQVTIEVNVPPDASTGNETVPSGCVSILVGFKK